LYLFLYKKYYFIYKMNRKFLKQNKLLVIILLLITFVLLIHQIKPAFLYERNGAIRNFGIGIKSKTIIPLWLIVIVMAILIYVAVDFYLKYM